jgi:ABC-type sugar transport system substrate-binding protein
MHTKKIALVTTNLTNPFFVDMVAGARAELSKHPGYQLIVQAPEKSSDVERQIQILENLAAQKIDVLCVDPADSKGIISTLRQFNSAGIPIIIVDVKLDPQRVKELGVHSDGFIGSDNFAGGELAGRFVVKQLHEQGRIAILEGLSGVEAAANRKVGFLSAFKQAPGIQVVASLPADWEREKGMNVFQGILQAHPDLDAVFACNDEMALGAARVPHAAHKLLFVGFDATDEARQAVKSGILDATVAQEPKEMGRLAVKNAIKLLEGKTIRPQIETPLELITR